MLYFNGSLMLSDVGAGIMLISMKGECFKYVLQSRFPVSNNVAKYEDLLNGLCIATSLGVRNSSSMEILSWWSGKSCRYHVMESYYQEVCKLEGKFDGL